MNHFIFFCEKCFVQNEVFQLRYEKCFVQNKTFDFYLEEFYVLNEVFQCCYEYCFVQNEILQFRFEKRFVRNEILQFFYEKMLCPEINISILLWRMLRPKLNISILLWRIRNPEWNISIMLRRIIGPEWNILFSFAENSLKNKTVKLCCEESYVLNDTIQLLFKKIRPEWNNSVVLWKMIWCSVKTKPCPRLDNLHEKGINVVRRVRTDRCGMVLTCISTSQHVVLAPVERYSTQF